MGLSGLSEAPFVLESQLLRGGGGTEPPKNGAPETLQRLPLDYGITRQSAILLLIPTTTVNGGHYFTYLVNLNRYASSEKTQLLRFSPNRG